MHTPSATINRQLFVRIWDVGGISAEWPLLVGAVVQSLKRTSPLGPVVSNGICTLLRGDLTKAVRRLRRARS